MKAVAFYEILGDIKETTKITSANTPFPEGTNKLRGGGKAVGSPLAFVRLNFTADLGGGTDTSIYLVSLIEDAGRPILAVLAANLCKYEKIALGDESRKEPGCFFSRNSCVSASSGSEALSILDQFGFIIPEDNPRKLMLYYKNKNTAYKIPEGTSMILTLLLGE